MLVVGHFNPFDAGALSACCPSYPLSLPKDSVNHAIDSAHIPAHILYVLSGRASGRFSGLDASRQSASCMDGTNPLGSPYYQQENGKVSDNLLLFPSLFAN